MNIDISLKCSGLHECCFGVCPNRTPLTNSRSTKSNADIEGRTHITFHMKVILVRVLIYVRCHASFEFERFFFTNFQLINRMAANYICIFWYLGYRNAFKIRQKEFLRPHKHLSVEIDQMLDFREEGRVDGREQRTLQREPLARCLVESSCVTCWFLKGWEWTKLLIFVLQMESFDIIVIILNDMLPGIRYRVNSAGKWFSRGRRFFHWQPEYHP